MKWSTTLILFLCSSAFIILNAQDAIKVYDVKNLTSKVILEKFQMLNDQIKTIDQPEGNRILVVGEEASVDLALQQMELLDMEQKMVSIEFMVVEYFHGNDFDWSFDLTGGRFGNFDDGRITTGALNGLQFIFNSVTRLSPKFRLNLSALVSENKAKIVSNPHLVVQTGNEATLEIADKLTLFLTQTNQNTGLVNQTQSDLLAGINLKINPIATADSIVHLDVAGEISQFLPFSTEGEIRTDVKRITTVVDLKVGETLIIGGIISEQTNEIDAGFPILRRIPLIGLLFKRKKKLKEHIERVIYLTPRVFTANEIAMENQLKNYEEVRKLNQLETEIAKEVELDPQFLRYDGTKDAFKPEKQKRKAKRAARKAARKAANQ